MLEIIVITKSKLQCLAKLSHPITVCCCPVSRYNEMNNYTYLYIYIYISYVTHHRYLYNICTAQHGPESLISLISYAQFACHTDISILIQFWSSLSWSTFWDQKTSSIIFSSIYSYYCNNHCQQWNQRIQWNTSSGVQHSWWDQCERAQSHHALCTLAMLGSSSSARNDLAKPMLMYFSSKCIKLSSKLFPHSLLTDAAVTQAPTGPQSGWHAAEAADPAK